MGPELLFWALIGRNLLRHRLRSALTLAGVALGVAVAVAVQLANHTALASFEGTVRAVTGTARLQLQSPGGDLDERVITRLLPLLDRAVFSPVVEGTAVWAGHPDVAFRLEGVDLLAPGAFRGYSAPPGANPTAFDPDGLFLTDSAAKHLGLKPGDRLPLWVNDRLHMVAINGVLPSDGNARTLDPQVAFLDVAAAQELFGRVGRLDRLDVLPRGDETPASLALAIAPLLPPGVTASEPEESNRQAGRMLASFRTNLLALSFVALIVGAYLIYNAVAVSVVQRRGDVATMRALGATRGQIFGLFALEAGVMGLLGAFCGLGLGAFLAGAAVGAVSRTVNSIYLVTAVQGVSWTPWAFATGLGAGVGLSLAAALFPAWEAASTPPALAMRRGSWEGLQRSRVSTLAIAGITLLICAAIASRGPAYDGIPAWGYAAAALVILGCSLLTPLVLVGTSRLLEPLAGFGGQPFKLAVRGFRGAVGRNAVAVASLMVGVALMIGVATMVGSFRETLTSWAEAVLRADLYLKPAAAQGARIDPTIDPTLVRAIARLPGVDGVDGYRWRPIQYDHATIRLGAGDARVFGRHGGSVMRDPGDDMPALARDLIGQDHVWISETLVIKHGLDRGQTIVLPTATGPHSFQITAVYHDYQSDQGYVEMDIGTYRRYWHDPAVSHIDVYAAPGANLPDLRGQVQRLVGTRPIAISSNGDLRREILHVFDNTFAITYALHAIAIAVSLLGVVSTLFALVLERQREISLMRYLGLTRGQVRRMIVAEAGLVGLCGAGIGLVAGGGISLLLIHVINRQSFGWTIQIHPPYGFIAVSLGLVMVAALLAGLVPAYVAANLPIAEGMRHE